MLLTFNSIPEFIAEVKSKVTAPREGNIPSWYGHVTFNEAIEKALHGCSSYVDEANKLIDQLSLAMPQTRAFKTIRSPIGARCNFSEWQTGSPNPMRRRVRASTDFGPLRIIVSTTSSAGIEAETMAKRGAAILALLLKLQEIRPIELHLLAEMHGAQDGWHYQLIRVETKPLDVSVAAFVLCNVGFARHLTYDLAREIDGFTGQWPRDYCDKDYSARRAERLSVRDEDIVIKEAHLHDSMIVTPVKWITEQLAKYTEGN